MLTNAGIRPVDPGGIEIISDFAENIFIAWLFQIGQNDRLGIGLSIRARQAHEIRRPEAQKLVPARHDLELCFLIQRVAGFFCALAIIECAHWEWPFWTVVNDLCI